MTDSRSVKEYKLYGRLKPSYIAKLSSEGKMPRIMMSDGSDADARAAIDRADASRGMSYEYTDTPKAKNAKVDIPKQSSRSTVESLKNRGGKAQSKLNTSTSIVDLLKSLGEDSSFQSRKKMAEEYGIGSDYTGTSEQNASLLSKVKSRRSATEPASSRPRIQSEPIMPKERSNPGLEVPESVDTEDITGIDSQLLEQNRDYLTAEDFRDGTWDSYVSFVKRARLKNPARVTSLPNFQEYTRISEDI